MTDITEFVNWLHIQMIHVFGLQVPGRIIQSAHTPQSYLVSTPSGEVRRNQSDLRPRISHNIYDGDNDSHVNTRSPIQTHSRSGVDIRPPDQLSY